MAAEQKGKGLKYSRNSLHAENAWLDAEKAGSGPIFFSIYSYFVRGLCSIKKPSAGVDIGY